mgnify:CR=1 FL=1
MEAILPEKPTHIIRFSDLANRKPTLFTIEPDNAQRARIAADLGIVALKKLRFVGEITPDGTSDWSLSAKLGATVVQSCVISLDPVTTRIDETIGRRYRATLSQPDVPELEMDGDDMDEQLPPTLDITDVMIEALSLALPAYPRKSDVKLDQAVFAAPGVAPLTDEDAKPFAGLGALKKSLSQNSESDT